MIKNYQKILLLILFLMALFLVISFVIKNNLKKEEINFIQEDKAFSIGTKKYNFIISEPDNNSKKIIRFEDLIFDILAERYEMSFYNKKIVKTNICLEEELNSNVLGPVKTISLFTKEGQQARKVSKIECVLNKCEYKWYYYFNNSGQCYIFESYLKFDKSTETEFDFSNVKSEKITDLKTKKIIDYIDRLQDEFILDLRISKFSDF